MFKNVSVMQNLFSTILRKVYAEDGNPTANQEPAPAPTTPVTNFEDLIAKARKEEKDKLYPQIEKLKADVESLTKRNNDLLLLIGDKDSKISDLEKTLKEAQKAPKSESQEVKELKMRITELETELTLTKTNAEKEVQKVKLETYKMQKMQGVELIPELVQGTTEAEIDASIEVAKARYTEIVGKVAQSKTTSPTPPVANPNTKTLDLKTLTTDQIRGMSSNEFANYRKQLGLK